MSHRPVGAVDPEPAAVSVPPLTPVLDLLEFAWHCEENVPQGYDEPLDGLVLIILSQNTNDRNRDVAFSRLKERCPAWNLAADLSQAELIDLIRPAGLCDGKAATIARALRAVQHRYGQYSLKAMRQEDPADCWNFLTGIKGVGVKTAACVFVFDLGFPAFPVDTHVARFCKRMGWFGPALTPAAIQEQMERRVPDERKAGAHLNIITHGRQVCKARNPLCRRCVLLGLCPSRQLTA